MKKNGILATYLMLGGIDITFQQDEEAEKKAFRKLGNGFDLRPLDIENNTSDYCNLYKDDVKVSDEVFRRGGLGGDFKDGYCDIIHYTPKKDKKKYPDGFGDATHVIINESGNVALKQDGLNYPYHIGGNVGSLKDFYYNLLTGEVIMPKGGTSIVAKNFLIIEHKNVWDYIKKVIDIPKGIYSINLLTCEVIKVDDIR